MGLANEEMAHIRQLSGLDDPLRDIGSAERHERATQLGRQPLVAFHVHPAPGANRHDHAEPTETACQPDRSADQRLGAGGTGNRDQHVLRWCQHFSGGGHRLRDQTQRDLPEGGEVSRPEEVCQRGFHLVRRVDVAMLHALAERLRRDVDELDLVGEIEHAVGQSLPLHDAGDLLDHVVDAFYVLHIQGGDDVDAGVPQLLDVLPPLLADGAGRVRMGELIDQGDLRAPRDDGVEIHLLEDRAAVRDLLARDQLEAAEELLGPGTAVGLDVGDGDILAALFSLSALFEHGKGLARPGCRAQVDLETAARRCRHKPRVLFPSPIAGRARETG